jgi:hypothetical protein
MKKKPDQQERSGDPLGDCRRSLSIRSYFIAVDDSDCDQIAEEQDAIDCKRDKPEPDESPQVSSDARNEPVHRETAITARQNFETPQTAARS